MKVGISSWSLLRSDLDAAVRTIGDAGFEYIELWGEVPHAYHEWVDKKRLKDTLSTYSFTITMHAPFTDLNPATPFEPVKGAVARTLKDFVRFADHLGASKVTFHPGNVHSGALVHQSVEDAVALIRHLVRETGGRLSINVENQAVSQSEYQFPLGSDIESVGVLLSSIEGTEFTLDTGHAHVGGGDPFEFYERFKGDLTEVHLSDNDGKVDDHLIPGRGTARLKQLLELLAGTDTLVCLELDPFKYSSLEVIQAAASLKRGLFP